MATFRSPFVRKDATRGSRPADGRLAAAGLTTARNDLGALPGIISGLAVAGVAGQWYYAVSAGHAVTVRSDADGANWPGLDGTTNTPTVAAAPGTGSRWDLIYIRQRDVDNADADSNSVIDVVQGTAGGSPTKPYASVPDGALVLAEAQVAAGATGTLHANVTITQVAAKVSTRGGIVPNPSTTQQTALNAVATATNPILIDDNGIIRRSVGSGWVAVTPVPGSVLLAPASVAGSGVSLSGGAVVATAAASVSVNGVFTTAYDAYMIEVNGTSSDSTIKFRLRASGTDRTGATDYAAGLHIQAASSVTGYQGSDSSWPMTSGTGTAHSETIRLYDPAAASATRSRWEALAVTSLGNVTTYYGGGHHGTAAASDGFTIYPASGTFTGKIRVYGLTAA